MNLKEIWKKHKTKIVAVSGMIVGGTAVAIVNHYRNKDDETVNDLTTLSVEGVKFKDYGKVYDDIKTVIPNLIGDCEPRAIIKFDGCLSDSHSEE